MIEKIKIKTGFATDLPVCRQLSKTKLSPGLNILWGANGSGKTTGLQVTAAYTFCHTGGWSRLLEPLEIVGPLMSESKLRLPYALKRNSPGKSSATLKWDRAPVFFANGRDQSRGSSLEGAADDGMGSVLGEILSQKTAPRSSGQTRHFKIRQMLQALGGAPDFRDVKLWSNINDTWRGCFEAQIEFLAERPENGRTTVLMDEPERNLDIAKAVELWSIIIPHLAKYAQVIVATHHPLALRLVGEEDVTWITSCPGEHEEALAIYRRELCKPQPLST